MRISRSVGQRRGVHTRINACKILYLFYLFYERSEWEQTCTHHKIQAHSPKDTFKKKLSLFVTLRIPGLQLKKSDEEWQPESFCRRGEENGCVFAHGCVFVLPQDGTHAVVADLKSCSSTAKRTLALTFFHIYNDNYSCPGILGCVCFAASTFDVL